MIISMVFSILAYVYDDDVLFENLSTCLVKIVDDNDFESVVLILDCVYDDDVMSMLIFCEETYFFLHLQIYICQAAFLLHYYRYSVYNKHSS